MCFANSHVVFGTDWSKDSLHVKLLQGAKDVEEEEDSRGSSRSLRSSALRFWATVLQRFPEGLDYNCFWPRFLKAVEPQMERMPTEVRFPAN